MIAEPRFVKEGWLDDSKPHEGWKLKENAPEWAKKEFEQFLEDISEEPDEYGRIRIYCECVCVIMCKTQVRHKSLGKPYFSRV